MDEDYVVHEDSLGQCKLPSTDAATIMAAVQDIFLRTAVSISFCRGEAYDGPAVIQGARSGVATRIRAEQPAPLFLCIVLCIH